MVKKSKNVIKLEEKLRIESLEDWLDEKYNVEMMNTREISLLMYGVKTNSPNVGGWMKKLGVPLRSNSEAVYLQWHNNPDRRKKQSEMTKRFLGANTNARKKLIKTMQTKEYKEKQRISKTGELNGMWNPELSEEEREKEKYHSRRYPGYKDFRKEVFERDGYACCICSDATGGNLVVHHLNGFHWDIKGRIEVNNGVTLCNHCHDEFHRIYGRKDNDLFQFSQFEQTKQTALVK